MPIVRPSAPAKFRLGKRRKRGREARIATRFLGMSEGLRGGNLLEILTSAAKQVSKDVEWNRNFWRTVFMLPKFTNKERDFFKKMGTDSPRADYEKSFLQSRAGIFLVVVLAGGLVGMLLLLWR